LGNILTGPIYDSGSGNIFVGDSTGRLSFIQEIGSTVGGTTTCTSLPATVACLNTVSLAVGTGGGTIVDAPVVDGTNGTVLAFGTTFAGTATVGTISQATTGLTNPVSFGLGGNNSLCNTSPACSPIYSGAFDNAYINSSKPLVVGHMYVCGKEPTHTDRPAIFQLSFDGNGVLTGVGTPLISLVAGSPEACSPVTEIYNSTAGTDWIFFSTAANTLSANNGAIPGTSNCTATTGCLMSLDVTNTAAWTPVTVPPVVNKALAMPPSPTPGTGFNPSSTSGIVVDNVADPAISPQASSIYFSYAENSNATTPCNVTSGIGCAVKLTQADLQ
jgi:hypothetical protein